MKDLKFKSNTFKAESEGIVSGYASKFGNIDSDNDIIAAGAYKKTIAERRDRIAFVWQHDITKPIGKALKLEEDNEGLFIEAKISDTALGRDAKTMIEDGVIKEFSVGFVPIVQEYNKETKLNTIKEIKLYEFSLVTIAANPEAMVTGYKGEFEPISEIERIIKCVSKLQTEELKHYVEFELLRLSKALQKKEAVPTLLDDEAEILKELNSILTLKTK